MYGEEKERFWFLRICADIPQSKKPVGRNHWPDVKTLTNEEGFSND